MKTCFLFSIFLLVANYMQAAILTVNNTTPSAAQYSNLQAAYNDALAGDTIYIQPTGVHYGTLTLGNKQNVTFIGGGFAPMGGSMPASIINDLQLPYSGANFSGNIFIGLRLNSFQFPGPFNTPPVVSNVSFIRCVFLNPFSFNRGNEANWLFDQCAFVNVPGASVIAPLAGAGHVFRNCIFYSGAQTNSGMFTINATNINFINCFFYRNFNGGNNEFQNTYDVNSSVNFINCILDEKFNLNLSPITYKFENNLAAQGPGTTNLAFMNNPSRSTNGQNIVGEPVFQFYSYPNVFNYLVNNLTLMPNSPGIGAGTNGLDVGPFGGVGPFVPGGIPPLPFIEFAELLTPTVPADQNLQIQVKANVQN